MSISPETFCKDWNPKEFYHLIRYRSWKFYFQNEYSKLMSLKAGAK